MKVLVVSGVALALSSIAFTILAWLAAVFKHPFRSLGEKVVSRPS
jgi:ABC-type sulfate transport system permease component